MSLLTVALGAAIQGAILDQVDSVQIETMVLTDVTPISLGIRTLGGDMCFIVNRNESVPVKRTRKFTNSYDYQDEVSIKVLEGESLVADNNNLLAAFVLTNLPKVRENELDIEVTFDIDYDGILKVTALEKSSMNQKTIEISRRGNGLTESEINDCVGHANRFDSNDEEKIKTVLAKNDLHSYCYGLLAKLDSQPQISDVDKQSTADRIQKDLNWLVSNPMLNSTEIDKRKKALLALFGDL